MPQMSPISWTLVFLAFLLFILLVLTLMKMKASPVKSCQPLSIKENNMKW